MPRPAVDPRFPARMRELRQRAGLSVRDLAKLVVYGKSYIHELETGAKPPTDTAAQHLDTVLDGGGELAAMVGMPGPPITPQDEDRLLYVARHPRRIDPGAVDALAAVLDGQRRLEDSIGARPMLAPALAQVHVVEELVAEARGDLRSRVVDIGAQWAQFTGWLHAQTRQPAAARQWYLRALEWATEADNPAMIGTALNMRGHLAWMAGEIGPMIGLSAAAARQPASPGVRSLAVQQEARGHAMTGDAADVDRLLNQAADLAAAAASRPEDEPPWVYFFNGDYLDLQRGLAYRYLGRYGRAVDLLTAGLAAVPADTRQSEWVGMYVYQLAMTHAEIGDVAAARAVLAEADTIATATGSTRLSRAVDRARLRFGLSADT